MKRIYLIIALLALAANVSDTACVQANKAARCVQPPKVERKLAILLFE